MRYLLFISIILVSLGIRLEAARPPGNTYINVGLKSVLSFGGGWMDEFEIEHSVPFTMPGRSLVTLKKDFEWPILILEDSVQREFRPDSLYIYANGIGWTGSIFINEVFIGRIEDPFGQYQFGLSPSLLVRGTNRIVVELSIAGPDFEYYPIPVIGIFRPLQLLAPANVVELPMRPKVVENADTAIAFSPWNSSGNEYSEREMLSHLVVLKKAGAKVLWFPFQPPGVMLSMARELGFLELRRLDSAKFIAFYNHQEFGSISTLFRGDFWIGNDGEQTDSFGKYYESAKEQRHSIPRSDQIVLIVLLVLVVIGLVLLRVITPRIYEAMPEYLLKSKIHFDLIRTGKFMRPGETIFLNFLRLFVFGICLSVLLYFIQTSGKFDSLNLVTEESSLFRILKSAHWSFLGIMLTVLGFLVLFGMLRYFLLAVLEFVYRRTGLALSMQNLDVLSSMPVNLVLLLPAACLFFLDPAWGDLIIVLWQLVFLAMMIRRIWVLVTGQRFLFNLPAGLIFLYICTLEILPWILLI